MPFDARAYRVMIASPGDCADLRKQLTDAMFRWNIRESEHAYFLIPWTWELASTAVSGRLAQAELNIQLVSEADVMIGVFKKKLGQATENYLSGTVEEITVGMEEFGLKPALFFYQGSMESHEAKDMVRVEQYRSDISRKQFYYRNYSTDSEFVTEAMNAIHFQIKNIVASTKTFTGTSELEAAKREAEALRQSNVHLMRAEAAESQSMSAAAVRQPWSLPLSTARKPSSSNIDSLFETADARPNTNGLFRVDLVDTDEGRRRQWAIFNVAGTSVAVHAVYVDVQTDGGWATVITGEPIGRTLRPETYHCVDVPEELRRKGFKDSKVWVSYDRDGEEAIAKFHVPAEWTRPERQHGDQGPARPRPIAARAVTVALGPGMLASTSAQRESHSRAEKPASVELRVPSGRDGWALANISPIQIEVLDYRLCAYVESRDAMEELAHGPERPFSMSSGTGLAFRVDPEYDEKLAYMEVTYRLSDGRRFTELLRPTASSPKTVGRGLSTA